MLVEETGEGGDRNGARLYFRLRATSLLCCFHAWLNSFPFLRTYQPTWLSHVVACSSKALVMFLPPTSSALRRCQLRWRKTTSTWKQRIPRMHPCKGEFDVPCRGRHCWLPSTRQKEALLPQPSCFPNPAGQPRRQKCLSAIGWVGVARRLQSRGMFN